MTTENVGQTTGGGEVSKKNRSSIFNRLASPLALLFINICRTLVDVEDLLLFFLLFFASFSSCFFRMAPRTSSFMTELSPAEVFRVQACLFCYGRRLELGHQRAGERVFLDRAVKRNQSERSCDEQKKARRSDIAGTNRR